jgi:hypothetical protein
VQPPYQTLSAIGRLQKNAVTRSPPLNPTTQDVIPSTVIEPVMALLMAEASIHFAVSKDREKPAAAANDPDQC